MTKHRIAPMPSTYRDWVPVGTCRWCGKDDVPKPKRYWHGDCVEEYLALTDVVRQRHLIQERDQGVCAGCGSGGFKKWSYHQKTEYPNIERKNISHEERYLTIMADHTDIWPIYNQNWEMDHIRPLWRSTELPDDRRVKFFELENLQTLCHACHKRKTRREAGLRAKLRKKNAA